VRRKRGFIILETNLFCTANHSHRSLIFCYIGTVPLRRSQASVSRLWEYLRVELKIQRRSKWTVVSTASISFDLHPFIDHCILFRPSSLPPITLNLLSQGVVSLLTYSKWYPLYPLIPYGKVVLAASIITRAGKGILRPPSKLTPRSAHIPPIPRIGKI
jgi:hypothetical protein